MMKVGRVFVLVAITMAFSLAFAQTNAQVSFQIRVDRSSPVYSNLYVNTSTIDAVNQSVLFSAYWEDTFEGLNNYIFEWNVTGAFVNSSAQSFDNGWSNVTRIVNAPNSEGTSVYYSFHAVDVNRNWNSTVYDSIYLISKSPEYYQISQSNSTPTAGDIISINSYWIDNFNVYNIVLQTNHTGTWLDNQTIIVNNAAGWANFTWDTIGYAGETVYWRINGFDNATNTNTTLENHFSVG